jgi:iron complex transport system substrate-binding protein
MRVVSLLPSATEWVAAVGALPQLVGVSHECDFPEAVLGLPVLTTARVPKSASSREIDAAVRSVIASGQSLYALDEERLLALEPNVILTQDLCEVCAVALNEVQEFLRASPQLNEVTVVNLRAKRFEDIFSDLERVGTALEREKEASQVAKDLRVRVERIRKSIETRGQRRLRVLSLEWVEPWMVAGSWMSDLIELAGGIPVGIEPGAPSRTIGDEEVLGLECDCVWIKPCGQSLQRALEDLHRRASFVQQWLSKGVRVIVSDGHHLFNRPGPRLVDSLELMAAYLAPDAFPDFFQKLSGWAFEFQI